jgi:hypothetical protein
MRGLAGAIIDTSAKSTPLPPEPYEFRLASMPPIRRGAIRPGRRHATPGAVASDQTRAWPKYMSSQIASSVTY